MFERYNEKARRTIFFARHEAGILGAPSIETEHLLLGLMREDGDLRGKLPSDAPEGIRRKIEERVPPPSRKAAASLDMPVGQDCRRALVYAAEESDALGQRSITCGHLLLGLLRVETSVATGVLREFGIEYATYREAVAEQSAPSPSEIPATGPLAGHVRELQRLFTTGFRFEEKGGPLKRSGWTRKQAAGHLIDWAAAHQQWFACALAGPRLDAAGYPEDNWPAAQHYDDLPWRQLVDLCVALNSLIMHLLATVPDAKLETPCRIGLAQPIPLGELASRYVAHCADIVAQLMTRN